MSSLSGLVSGNFYRPTINVRFKEFSEGLPVIGEGIYLIYICRVR